MESPISYTFTKSSWIDKGFLCIIKVTVEAKYAKKNIKRKILILLIIFISTLFALTACDPGHYSFDYSELQNTVVDVELIDYKNIEQEKFFSWVPNHFSKLVPFNLDNMTVIETLESEYISDFLEQLSEVSFLYEYYCYNSPKDICIRLIYDNGDFEVISCNYQDQSFAGHVGRYNSDGEVISFVGSFASLGNFVDLVNNFFETQIS